MEQFFSLVFSFPTLIFTLLLLFACGYWLLAVIGLLDIDIGGSELGGLGGVMVTLGLTGVPLPLVLTLLFLWGWVVSFLLCYTFAALPALICLIVAMSAALPLTVVIVKPLAPLFRALHAAPEPKQFVGNICTVRSGRVDASFGEAVITMNGAEIVLQVRSEAHLFQRGDKGLIFEQEEPKNIYWIAPLEE
ncbi:DUF1449 family protein [Ectothiorhodospiraceae bacterium BW-2]|nr:DUF1449 family protein [Ectothiorhodospiraceae bacterium BW-2]